MKEMCLDVKNPLPPPVWSFVEFLNINFVFPLEDFWSKKSNSWDSVDRFKFPSRCKFISLFYTTFVFVVFALTLVDECYLVSLIHYTEL
jgi:hypothetical protein